MIHNIQLRGCSYCPPACGVQGGCFFVRWNRGLLLAGSVTRHRVCYCTQTEKIKQLIEACLEDVVKLRVQGIPPNVRLIN